MPIIPEMPEILIINFGKGASHTGSRSTTGSNGVLGRFRFVGQKQDEIKGFIGKS